MIARATTRLWLLLLLAIGGVGTARAQNFDFSYTANGTSVMGTFVTTSQGNGQYLITSILNGTRGGNAITLLAPGSTAANDNILFFPANPDYLDTQGVGFRTSTTVYNVFRSSPGTYLESTASGGGAIASNFQVTAVPAPLPGGGLLSFLALGLAGLVARRRTILRVGRDALARLGPRPPARTA